jgi:hypothetical protein
VGADRKTTVSCKSTEDATRRDALEGAVVQNNERWKSNPIDRPKYDLVNVSDALLLRYTDRWKGVVCELSCFEPNSLPWIFERKEVYTLKEFPAFVVMLTRRKPLLDFNTLINNWLLKAQWLLCIKSDLALENPTFCPHSVFMCFMWISEQTAIINWLVFITETECVYYAVRTESLYLSQGYFIH